MYKFDEIEFASKEFNSVYQIKKDVSEGVVANKHDTRYIIGYELEPGKLREDRATLHQDSKRLYLERCQKLSRL